MAYSKKWNRPNDSMEVNSCIVRSASMHGLWHFATSILGIIVLACLVIWLFSGKKRNGNLKSTRHVKASMIAETKQRIMADEKSGTNFFKDTPSQRIGEVRDGKVLMPDGELRIVKGEVTNSIAQIKPPYAIFKHSSENIIAGLLATEPGTMTVGTPRYNGVFTKNFLKSLDEPIVIDSDDNDDIKSLKLAVKEAKLELKAAYDRGENIEQIVLDSRAEFQRLARVREDMKRNVLKAASESVSNERDMEDLLEAANKILETEGIAPIDDTPLMRAKLWFMNEQEHNKTKMEDLK